MFTGSYVALITPFRDGFIEKKALADLVEWQIDNGTNGLVPMGTTGESPTVSHDEHKRVIEIVVEATAGRIPVIAGAGSNNPVEALEHARHAQQLGADGILSVAGYYNRPSQEGLYQHFKLIHDATDIPIIVYNIPPRVIVDIRPETMARLAQLPRIVGVKDATAELSRVSLERQLIDKNFSYLSGEDMTAIAYNAQGGKGCISVTANIAPSLCARMQSASLSGDYKAALRYHEQLMPLHTALFLEPSPAGVKYAASRLGLCSDEVRSPILRPGEATRKAIDRAIESLK